MKQKRPANETNAERFRRIAESRTKVILKQLRLLSNCANKRLYTYNREEVDKIFNTIQRQMKVTKSNFNFVRKEDEFKL